MITIGDLAKYYYPDNEEKQNEFIKNLTELSDKDIEFIKQSIDKLRYINSSLKRVIGDTDIVKEIQQIISLFSHIFNC